jgi:hypothetical protein
VETTRRRVKDGRAYDALFPKATGTTQTIKRDAQVSHTVNFIPKVVKNTLDHTVQLIPVVKGKTLYDTCHKIWDFVYDHISYEKDAHGKEQVRSPRRTWADRETGVDCDCYTTFISSILTNMRIPHTLRITKYKKDYFQHIYPIVPIGNGKYITIDCVVHAFDYEEPFTEKKDKIMDLEYLDGVNDDASLFDGPDDEMGEIGKLKIGGGQVIKKISTAVKKVAPAIKKAAHIVNRVNPAIGLLRIGLLASMKLNLMKVAGQLRWAYLSEEQAKQKGILIDKYKQLKQVLSKLEQIFYGAGGKPENLKKAIVDGRGNKDKSVSGLGIIQMDDNHSEATRLSELLGDEVYTSEMQGLEGLGEPVTAASIAAATGALATIAGLIKKIGDIFPKGNKKNEEGTEEGSPTEKVDVDDSGNDSGSATMVSALTPAKGKALPDAADNPGTESFWDKNKTWLQPTAIGVGVLTAAFLIFKMIPKKTDTQKQPAIAGIDGIKKRKKRKGNNGNKKTPIALM